MQAVPYLNFDGTCREAMEFYQQVLGGELIVVTTEEMPMEGLDDSWDGKVLNAQLTFNGQLIMASDLPPGDTTKVQGFSVALLVDSAEEAERIFNAFSEGGLALMPFGEVPWAERFGMMTDRYGTPWMVSYEGNAFS